MVYKLSFSKTALKNLLKISANKRKIILEKLGCVKEISEGKLVLQQNLKIP